jgi:hypothetical protein
MQGMMSYFKFDATLVESQLILTELCQHEYIHRNKAKLHSNQGWTGMVLTPLIESSSSTLSKQYAMKTLAHLASEVQNKVMIVNYENGTIVKALVRLISSTSSIDRQLNITAAELIGSLICRANASIIVSCQPGFLVTLASLACGEDQVANPSAKVLKKLSTYVHSYDDCHTDLLQALVTMSYGALTEVLKLTVKAFVGELSCHFAILQFTISLQLSL